jgi:peptidoglycan/LPS O-acetylase OafA/YrhL
MPGATCRAATPRHAQEPPTEHDVQRSRYDARRSADAPWDIGLMGLPALFPTSMVASDQAYADRTEMRAHFRPDIEGLRAVAVLAVLLFHVGVPGLPGGFVGVDVFYVISGFLITGLLVRELAATGRIDLVTFYARRLRRLLPAALVVIAVTLVASWAVLSRLRFPEVAGDAAASALYVSNIRFAEQATDYLAAHESASPYLHFWSLGVEEQFYLVWPFLLLIGARLVPVARLGILLVAVALGSFALSLAWTDVAAPWAFFSLPTRAWELAIGALIAVGALRLPRRAPRSVAVGSVAVGLALIALACVVIDGSTPYPGTAALLPVAGTSLVIIGGAATRAGPSRWLSMSAPRWLGRISYSLYLWHWPILVLVPVALGFDGVGLRLVLAGAAVALAAVTTALIETPIRRERIMRAGADRSLAVAAACSIAMAVTAVGAGVLVLTRSSSPVVAAVEGALPDASPAPAWAATPAPAGAAATEPPTRTAPPAATPPAAAPPAIAPPAERPSAEPGVRPARTAIRSLPWLRDSTGPRLADRRIGILTPAIRPIDLGVVRPSIGDDLPPGVLSGPLPTNLQPSLEDGRKDLPSSYADGCHVVDYGLAEPGECVYGKRGSAVTAVLIGDSHAAQWLPALQRLADERGWSLLGFTKSGCPMVDATVWNGSLKRAYRECDSWRATVLERLAKEDISIAFVANADMYQVVDQEGRREPPDQRERWRGALASSLATIGGLADRVVVLADTPRLAYDPLDCLATHDDVAGCDAASEDLLDPDYAALEAAVASAAGVEWISANEWICPDGSCPLVRGTLLVFRDDHHLTATFAAALAERIGAALDGAVPSP